jgi:hypothetical protein
VTRGLLALGAMAAAVLTLACARDGSEQADAPAQASPDSGARTPAAPSGPPRVGLAPAGGAPGAQVTVSLDRLVMNADVDVGFGDLQEHVILARGKADVDGSFSMPITVPADAAPGTHYVFLADTTGQMLATPTAFLVAAPGGRVTLNGTMSDEGVECAGLEDASGALYTLTGSDDWPEAGTAVTVEGTIAEMSICQQGLTIAVESIKALR